jgi:hypothetical protein
VQRIVAQLARPSHDVVEEGVVVGDVAVDQLAGEVALVAEVIEEPALGDAAGLHQLLDGGGGEALLDQPLARPLTLRAAVRLYRRCSFRIQGVGHLSPPTANSRASISKNVAIWNVGKPTAHALEPERRRINPSASDEGDFSCSPRTIPG